MWREKRGPGRLPSQAVSFCKIAFEENGVDRANGFAVGKYSDLAKKSVKVIVYLGIIARATTSLAHSTEGSGQPPIPISFCLRALYFKPPTLYVTTPTP
jgi:hypothetical protein